jgi:hypothetical protein
MADRANDAAQASVKGEELAGYFWSENDHQNPPFPGVGTSIRIDQLIALIMVPVARSLTKV